MKIIVNALKCILVSGICLRSVCDMLPHSSVWCYFLLQIMCSCFFQAIRSDTNCSCCQLLVAWLSCELISRSLLPTDTTGSLGIICCSPYSMAHLLVEHSEMVSCISCYIHEAWYSIPPGFRNSTRDGREEKQQGTSFSCYSLFFITRKWITNHEYLNKFCLKVEAKKDIPSSHA